MDYLFIEKVSIDILINGFIIVGISYTITNSLNFYIYDPIKRYFEIREKIASDLSYYSNIYSNLGMTADFFNQKLIEMESVMRSNAAKLSAFTKRRNFTHITLPSNSDLEIITGKLYFIANASRASHIDECLKKADEINHLLGTKLFKWDKNV